MSAHDDWRRVSKQHPCPVCERPDWCAVSVDGAVALCQRIESPKRVGDAGWLHRLQDAPWRPSARHNVRTVHIGTGNAAQANLTRLAASYRAAVNPDHLQQLAESLGVSVASLRRLAVGWSSSRRAWSFPMTDLGGDVLGIRLRRANGFKFAETGGHDGLFIPGGDDSASNTDSLLIVEGPTDTAALLEMGFSNVVGRPNCMGGTRLLVELVKAHQPREAVIVADGDGAGVSGAETLASVLVGFARVVRVIQPPDGIRDARALLRAGGTRQDVQQLINAAPVRRLRIRAASVAGR